MATSYLDQADLKAAINAAIDHATQLRILGHLIDVGIGTPARMTARRSRSSRDLASATWIANVLIETNANNTIKLDADLKAIIEATDGDVTPR